jgi:choice-of-anchor B domain-containing protein
MRKIYILLFSLTVISSFSQLTYPSLNINLLSHLDPETNIGFDNRKYSGCWGWFQSSKNKEYAIVGTSAKTYFIDVTNPLVPKICDSVMGRRNACTWRELKNYQNYCYVVSDDASPNSFQIIDMKYLPDSVHVVYDDTTYFKRAHTIWVDGNKLYVAGSRVNDASPPVAMLLYSLATPSVPVLLRSLVQDYSLPGYVHDMFARNDTIFASGGGDKLYVFKYNSGINKFNLLGSLTSYPESGYNHSSSLTTDGKTLVFCDENTNLSIKVADVSNLSNITPVALVRPNNDPGFIAHNPYVVGNEWVYVSCYQDGLLLYDITTPSAPAVKGFFDTYPQGGSGVTTNYNGSCCRGNWGAYTYLPSGIIIACDMQNGVYILKPSSIIGVKEENKNQLAANISPNPASDKLNITFASDDSKTYKIEITNVLGETIYSENNLSDCGFPVVIKNIDLNDHANGTYLISIKTDKKTFQQKFIIAK